MDFQRPASPLQPDQSPQGAENRQDGPGINPGITALPASDGLAAPVPPPPAAPATGERALDLVFTAKSNIYTYSEFVGDSNDFAEIVITKGLSDRIKELNQALLKLSARSITIWENSPEFKFVGDSEARPDLVRLVVTDDTFFWSGTFKHSSHRWETGGIQISELDGESGRHLDIREYIDDEEITQRTRDRLAPLGMQLTEDDEIVPGEAFPQQGENSYGAPAPALPPTMGTIAQFASESWDLGTGVTFRASGGIDQCDKANLIFIGVDELKRSLDWGGLPSDQQEALEQAAAWIVDLPDQPSGVNPIRVTGYLSWRSASEAFDRMTQDL